MAVVGADINRTAGFVFVGVLAIVSSVVISRHTSSSALPKKNEVDTSNLTGWLAVFGAIIIFGSYGIMIKAPAVVAAKVDPMVFQLYYSLGTALATFLVLTEVDFVWSYWGSLGAALWITTGLGAYMAIRCLGLSVACAVWAGETMVVSFLWGTLVFDNALNSLAGSIFGLATLVVGIGGCVSAQSDLPLKIWSSLGWAVDSGKGTPSQGNSPMLTSGMGYHSTSSTSPGVNGPTAIRKRDASAYTVEPDDDADHIALLYQPESPDQEHSSSAKAPKRVLLGFFFATVVGLANGSLMVPMHYFSDDFPHEKNIGISYLGSFAVGVLLVTPVYYALYTIVMWLVTGQVPPLHFDVAFVPGTVTGIFWAAGNFCATYSTVYLGNTIGYPLTQTAITVTGLWGIFYYKEITETPHKAVFFVSVFVVIGGAVLLAKFA